MENVPPSNNNPNVPEEEPILDQAPATLVGFASQWMGGEIPVNNNGWLGEEDPEEVPEEEDEDMVNDEEDDDEVINPYEEADPHNRPPPTSDKETEFAPPVVQIADADDVPIPPVIQLGSNFHVRESLATRDLLAGNSEVYAPGPMCCDLKSVHRGVNRLNKKMHDMYRTEKKMAKKLRQDELRMNCQVFDITALDSAEEPSIYTAPVPHADDPYVMVRDASMDTRGDEDVNTDVPWDTQPSEPRGSPPAIKDERERVRLKAARTGGPARGPAAAHMARECSFTEFLKCGPTQFQGTEGAIGLVRWFEKMENTFEISECVEGKKVKFSTATLHGRALTWCNFQEVQRLEEELRHLKLRDMNIAAYTERFNELAFLCPDVVPNEKKKVKLYTKGLPEIIKSNVVFYECMERGHKSRACPKKADRRGGNVQDIKPVKLNSSYEVELADGKVVSTNSVLTGCTLNLLDHLFDIDLMPIELGTFDVIVGMDWLVECDVLIVCGKKEVHMPYKNKTLVVKSDSSVCRLKVISCIKARKYIESRSQLFIAQVMKKEPAKKQLQDVPVIRNFPEVFPDDLPGPPPPRQVEFKIELIPDAAPVVRAPYRLAPSELKELLDQLKELSEKGFIRPSSSP
nr:putative reverse transcriptase domain-containing protein [Tanacetum cinerariifolium]